MKIVRNVLTHDADETPVALTIGNFDGVHLGHRALIDLVKQEAEDLGGESALLTLSPHPQTYFDPEHPPTLLTSDSTKEMLLAEAGLDRLYYLPFNRDTAGIEREAFLDEILIRRCGARTIVVGHDFRFGKGAQGDFEFLDNACNERGLKALQFETFTAGGEVVSSTRIRELIAEGAVERLPALLGRHHFICGPVVTNRGLGKQIGFPTANIDSDVLSLPPDGIYAGRIRIEGHDTEYSAAVNIGFAPTLQHDARTVEAHILDFDEDVTGKGICLSFYKRLRGEKKFDSTDALIEAIRDDVAAVREYFDASKSGNPLR